MYKIETIIITGTPTEQKDNGEYIEGSDFTIPFNFDVPITYDELLGALTTANALAVKRAKKKKRRVLNEDDLRANARAILDKMPKKDQNDLPEDLELEKVPVTLSLSDRD